LDIYGTDRKETVTVKFGGNKNTFSRHKYGVEN
jgi:hypothetical protein